MRSARYRQVDQTDNINTNTTNTNTTNNGSNSISSNNDSELSKKKSDRIDRITSKLFALIIVIVAAVVAKSTNILYVAFHDDRVNRFALNIALVCFFANMCIMFYLLVWLDLIVKITVPWPEYCPNMIPASTALGLACVLLLMISLWSVYGILTPIIVLTLLMGLLFLAHFIPSW